MNKRIEKVIYGTANLRGDIGEYCTIGKSLRSHALRAWVFFLVLLSLGVSSVKAEFTEFDSLVLDDIRVHTYNTYDQLSFLSSLWDAPYGDPNLSGFNDYLGNINSKVGQMAGYQFDYVIPAMQGATSSLERIEALLASNVYWTKEGLIGLRQIWNPDTWQFEVSNSPYLKMIFDQMGYDIRDMYMAVTGIQSSVTNLYIVSSNEMPQADPGSWESMSDEDIWKSWHNGVTQEVIQVVDDFNAWIEKTNVQSIIGTHYTNLESFISTSSNLVKRASDGFFAMYADKIRNTFPVFGSSATWEHSLGVSMFGSHYTFPIRFDWTQFPLTDMARVFMHWLLVGYYLKAIYHVVDDNLTR